MEIEGPTKEFATDDSLRIESEKPSAKPFRFGFLVHDVSRMRRTLFDAKVRPLGITRSQWSLLAALSRMGDKGMMQVELARHLDVGKVTVGGLVQRMVAAGLLRREKDAYDARVRRVFITDKGYQIIQEMESIGTANNDSILQGVAYQDLRIAEEVLAKVKVNIRAELKKLGQ
ncbi:MarR family transcriptional regulator [Parasphingorhabdus sp.]|uniref:MarR family winged helix-turn-helix transcriptional regulator n=1 Tax=Parasphingorhabdus sp. TaxID=2709688 RepID=UPI0032EFE079